MRNLVLAIVMTSVTSVFSQNNEGTGKFIRVFDLTGEKIAKGHVISLEDHELVLKSRKLRLRLPVNNIGYLKTGRSAGHNVLLGTSGGAAVGAILGIAAVSEDDGLLGVTSDGENIVSFAVLGALGGTLAGGVTIPFKKTKKFQIDGDSEKWQEFRNFLNQQGVMSN